tara:strand:- start:45 stop:470 length:426 start_codon:yes stop_codon:yes gene_type:complete
MALVRDFELPSTGLTAPNAYHVIKKVTTEKRMNDVPAPPDPSRRDGQTPRQKGHEVYWRAGYVGRISIEVYTSREARDNGKEPIGAITINPTDVEFNGSLSTDISDFDLNFFIDPTSQESIVDQAYTHLKGLVYYQNATEG